MTRHLASYLRFFHAGVVNSVQTGALVPSQRFLVRKMIAPVPKWYSGRIIELGAGSGALTSRLAARCPAARILACEINPALARDNRHNLAAAGFEDRVELVCEAAEHLLPRLRGEQKVDFVISGIPLGTLDRDRTCKLLNVIHEVLDPGGMYIQFQYSLLDRKKIRSRFRRLRVLPVFLNIPPAMIYYARR
jgi:phospholipid N-methyltransferase